MIGIYGHSSKPKALEEWINQARYKQFLINQDKNYILTKREDQRIIARALLDSSLITATQTRVYTLKIIHCGCYFQIYKYDHKKVKKDGSLEADVDNDFLFKAENLSKKNDKQVIELKNIMRSKFQMQRLIKANESEFKTFLTLTFADEVGDSKIANKTFHTWCTKIKSIYKDFKYVAVPEFQKKREQKYGKPVLHFHLLTNLEVGKEYTYFRRGKKCTTPLIVPQTLFTEKQLERMSKKQRSSCYDVKYWSYGYSSVESMKDMNVVGYLSKYMTKDIDNRLFGQRKYFYSLNLNIPKTDYVDIESDIGFLGYLDIINSCEITFNHTYVDKLGNEVEFIEFKKMIDS